MASSKNRSLTESSSDEDDGRKQSVIVSPKKRKQNGTDGFSSSDEGDLRVSFSNHPKKRHVHSESWSSQSTDNLHEHTGTASSESSNEDQNESDDGRSAPSLSTSTNSMPYFGLATTKKSNSPVMNNVALKMMANMGYKAGEGLGKYGQGRTEIIETSKQRGRRGLGLKLKGLEPCDITWNFEKEEVSVEVEILWIPPCRLDPPDMSELRSWISEGKRKFEIQDETQFCDPYVLRNVLSCKDVFDELEPEELRKARLRSNPFETIRGVFFQNRAAVKMAEMDAAFGFMFTNPKDEQGDPVVSSKELLYFADICAGPGGFSEYVLWRKKWHCKGFGFTLRGQNDFKLEEFFAGTPETFEPHYGINGIDGNGDIYVPENLRAFRRFVLENTDNKGVHFVMADGGFSVEGQENIQEILSKRLYLCQFLCALFILRIGGHFVCKVFDLFSPFSVGLVYLLYRTFQNVCIHKPNTSRPANSERYIVCKWKRENVEAVHDYMYEVNCRLKELKDEQEDVTEVVPLEIIKEEQGFYDYIFNSNNMLGERQIISLAKIQAFVRDSELHEKRQADLRNECLRLWQLPEKMRSHPTRPEPGAKFNELFVGKPPDYFGCRATDLDEKSLQDLHSVYDFRCVVCSVDKANRTDRAFFLGLGRSHIFRWDGTIGNRWVKQELVLELPAGTLVYAEIVQELKGEGKAQRKILALHIIDALFLGGENVQDKHYTERLSLALLLVKAVSKPSRTDYTPIRVKHIFRLEDAPQVFERLEMKTVKGSGHVSRLCFKMEDDRHFLPSGLLIMKTEKDPWTIAFSRTHNRKYHFNIKTRASSYQCPEGSIAPFINTFKNRWFWAWETGVKLLDNHKEDEGKIHRNTFTSFVAKRLSS